MADKYINKVIIGNDVKLDLTGDTITSEDLKKNVTAHDKSGAPIVGTNTFDADTQDATAAAAELLDGKTAYARGAKLTGTMPNQGSKTLTIAVKTETPAIPMGFHDGSGQGPDRRGRTGKDHPRQHQAGRVHPWRRGHLWRRGRQGPTQQERHPHYGPADHHPGCGV